MVVNEICFTLIYPQIIFYIHILFIIVMHLKHTSDVKQENHRLTLSGWMYHRSVLLRAKVKTNRCKSKLK